MLHEITQKRDLVVAEALPRPLGRRPVLRYTRVLGMEIDNHSKCVMIVIRDGSDFAISSCLFGNVARCGVESREWEDHVM